MDEKNEPLATDRPPVVDGEVSPANEPPKKIFSQRFYALIGTAIVALTIIVGAFALFTRGFFTSTPIPSQDTNVLDTSNWKTYRNEEFGFEFKYPTSARIIENEHPFNTGIQVSLQNDFTDTSRRIFDVLYYDRFLEGEALKEYLNPDRARGPGDIVSTAEVFIPYHNTENNLEGFASQYGDYIVVPRGKSSVVGFSFDALNTVSQNSFLTFKFLDPLDTSNWKTYRNEEFGFEVRYPAKDWDIVKSVDGITVKNVSGTNLTGPFYEQIPLGEAFIRPRVTLDALREAEICVPLPIPAKVTEAYFLSIKGPPTTTCDRFHTYLGMIHINGREGFQFIHSEYFTEKWSIFDNGDGTWFAVNGYIDHQPGIITNESAEPYDSILSTFQFLDL
jgi:hypothetical protein